jgi:dCMP deaminase
VLGINKRPSIDEYYIAMATLVASRSTCRRRMVGCSLTDAEGVLLSTGYNGVPRGQPHCIETPCEGAGMASGTGLDVCEAIHAEQNAIGFCRDKREIHTCYTTTAPCISCLKLLMNTPCQRIVYLQDYTTSVLAQKRWTDIGREWKHVSLLGTGYDYLNAALILGQARYETQSR